MITLLTNAEFADHHHYVEIPAQVFGLLFMAYMGGCYLYERFTS